MKKFTITAIKKDGLRHMAFNNDGTNTYTTEDAANEMLQNVLKNNSAERVADLIGKDLEVTPVDCYDSGDAKRTIF